MIRYRTLVKIHCNPEAKMASEAQNVEVKTLDVGIGIFVEE
jgi:hypothetical protein